MEVKEDLNGFLIQNSLVIFIVINIICLFVSFCIMDSKDTMGIREQRRFETRISSEETETVEEVNFCETIFFSFIQILILIEFLFSFIKKDEMKRVLSMKYLFLFMIFHFIYFFVSCLIL